MEQEIDSWVGLIVYDLVQSRGQEYFWLEWTDHASMWSDGRGLGY